MKITDFTAKLEDLGFTDIKQSESEPTEITFINTNETEFTLSLGTALSVYDCKFRPLGKRNRSLEKGQLLKNFDFEKALTL